MTNLPMRITSEIFINTALQKYLLLDLYNFTFFVISSGPDIHHGQGIWTNLRETLPNKNMWLKQMVAICQLARIVGKDIQKEQILRVVSGWRLQLRSRDRRDCPGIWLSEATSGLNTVTEREIRRWRKINVHTFPESMQRSLSFQSPLSISDRGETKLKDCSPSSSAHLPLLPNEVGTKGPVNNCVLQKG